MRATNSVVAVRLLACVLALGVVPRGVGPAAADDLAPKKGARLETRIFHVGALTMGRPDFIGEQPPPTAPDDVSDEYRPLFGAESEEPAYPVGQVDELIELVLNSVESAFWERQEGASLHALGERTLVARGTPRVLDAVAIFLARLESDVFATATVQVQAVRLPEGGVLPTDQAAIEALVAGPGAGPAVAVTAFLDQRASAFSGRQYAYVADFDTDVAQEAAAADPITMVANLGLGLGVRTVAGDDASRLVLELDIRLSDLDAPREASAGGGRTVEVPSFWTTEVRSTVEVAAGAWTALGGTGGWAFFVRATSKAPNLAPARAAPLPSMEAGSGAPMTQRLFDVTDLATLVPHRMTGHTFLVPSNYTPPEPPELPDCAPQLPLDTIVELLLHGAHEHWAAPASIDVRHGRLLVRNEPALIEGTARLLEALRREFLRPVRTRFEVIEVGSLLARRLARGGAAGPVLDEAARRALDAALRAGEARRVESADVVGRMEGRTGVHSGRAVTYLQDYETAIAQGATIANPVMQYFLSGVMANAAVAPTSGGKAVALEVRFMRTAHEEPFRRLHTEAGPVELPELDVLRARTSLVVPLGATALLASQGDGPRSRVLLVTPSER